MEKVTEEITYEKVVGRRKSFVHWSGRIYVWKNKMGKSMTRYHRR